MKKFIIILIALSIFSLISCNKNNPISTETNSFTNTGLKKILPRSNFGFMMWKDQFPGMDLVTLGPNGEGWNSIALHVHSGLYGTATSQGYFPKIAIITRNKAAAGLSTYNMDRDLNSLFTEIEHAKAVGANWIMIDDALTMTYANGDSNRITFNDMCRIGLKAKEQGLLLAVSEDCKTIFSHPNYYISQNWELYDYVQIIMPYGYDRTISQLDSFYSWIKAHSKTQVPFLGFHCLKDGYYRYQTKEFIDNAKKYSQTLFYFLEGDGNTPPNDNFLPYLNQLTNYLQTNGYIFEN